MKKDFATEFTTEKRIKYRYKFIIWVVIGIIFLILANYLENNTLNYIGGLVLTISGWYFIMTIFEFLDELGDSE